MEKEFIPYEQALALKELGFDESCFAIYDKKILKSLGAMQRKNSTYPDIITAPLYQQAFRWFREKYDLKKDYGIFPHHTIMFNYIINGGNQEQAELECLKKLIEICKKN
jgi:hypothetical protein